MSHRLGNALALPALKLSSQQIAQPAFQQRNNATKEEQPDTPHWRPETYSRSLTHRACVEAVVYQMLQVLQEDKAACSASRLQEGA